MKIPSRETLNRWLLTRDAPVFVQFTKYGLCGAAATFVLTAIVLALSYTLIPAMDGMIVDGEPITRETRRFNLIVNNLIAFPFANLAAYLLNARFVFTPGRHSRRVEFLIFTAVSFIGHFAGLLAGPQLIVWLGIPSLLAQLVIIITSVLVNFICRKFIVFEK